MTHPHRFLLAVFALFMTLAPAAFADAVPGSPAPDFKVTDAEGKTHRLKDYHGEWLVLEWFNKDCPYVKKHYGSDNMQTLQREYTGQKDTDGNGVKWLTVISSAKGKQGYHEPREALSVGKAHDLAASAPFLLDTTGAMGKAYGAKTTPHMYIIDPEGQLVYAGGIDDNDSANPAVIPTSENYVKLAMDQALAGKKITTPSSRPYGCSVKY